MEPLALTLALAGPDPTVEVEVETLDLAVHPARLCPIHQDAMVVQILALGADINEKDQHGNTPLSIACTFQNPTAVMTLLALKANPNSINAYGDPVLSIAAAESSVEVLKLLVANGARINSGSQYTGLGALHVAITQNQCEVVQQLLELRADPDAMDFNYRTPLDTARWVGCTDIEAVLRQYCTVIDPELNVFEKLDKEAEEATKEADEAKDPGEQADNAISTVKEEDEAEDEEEKGR